MKRVSGAMEPGLPVVTPRPFTHLKELFRAFATRNMKTLKIGAFRRFWSNQRGGQVLPNFRFQKKTWLMKVILKVISIHRWISALKSTPTPPWTLYRWGLYYGFYMRGFSKWLTFSSRQVSLAGGCGSSTGPDTKLVDNWHRWTH